MHFSVLCMHLDQFEDGLPSIDDLNTPLFGPAEPKSSGGSSANDDKDVSSKKKTSGKTSKDDRDSSDSDSGSSNSSDESGSDSESGSGSESGSASDSSKGSRKSVKSEKSEKSITLAKTVERKPRQIPQLEDTDSQDTQSSSRFGPRKSNLIELKQEWDQRPDLYGIRRSGRSRREVVRYVPTQGSGSDGDGKKKRKGRGKRKDSEDWGASQDDSEQESGSEEDFRPTGTRITRRATKVASRSKRLTRSRPAPKSSRSRQRKLSSSGSSDSDDSDSRRATTRRNAAQKVRDKVRPSRRKVAKKAVSYKEDSDDVTDSDDIIEATTPANVEEENKETIERVLDHRFGKKGATGSKTTDYNVQDHGDPNTSGSSLNEQRVNGLKKLENYIKREEEIEEWKENATPEDIEYFECQQEMMIDLYRSHQNVDRIIAHQQGEYMCKWVGLPYSECTWEDEELIRRLYQNRVDQFHARLKSQRIPTKLSKVLKVRPKFVPLKTQPAHLGSDQLVLRDYQLDGLNWLIHSWTKNNSVILADEMGLGKTIQIVSFMAHLVNSQQLYGPFLLVVPLSTVNAWQRECENWAPELNVVVYIGDVSSRNTIKEYEWCHPGNKRLKFNVLITTYEICLKDKGFLGKIPWAFLGVDEAHRLKNDDSLLYRCLEEFDTNHRILVTGTPLQNSLKELWSLLHFIMPNKFDSWSEFEERHSRQDRESFTNLHKQLEPYLLRRVKKDVEKSLPSKVEQILRVEMTSIQKQYYKWILTKNYKALSKGQRGNVTSFVNIIMELKKCCNHAHLTRTEEDSEHDRLQTLIRGSGKLILLDKLLVRLKDTGHRVLIFSQMVRMLDILAEYLQLRHFPHQRLDGSIRGDVRKQAMDHFNAEGSTDFCFLLSTRAGGLGVNLATADTVIIFDSDWNPQNDLQAQARAHRIGQKNQVSVYRLVTKQSVEETIVERAKKKMVLDHLVIQSMDTTGRTVLNRGTAPSRYAHVLLMVDIDEILKFAETHETEASTAGDELLSQFKVVSFENMEEDTNDVTMDGDDAEIGKEWEDIIPEDLRSKVEEEERQQQLLQLHLPPRSRKTIKQPKKRGRPRSQVREKLKGFTDSELRRFIKSYKKFAQPLTRLDAIACDAELQEKSEADLRHLAEVLQKNVDEAMAEYQQKIQEDPSFDGKKTHRGPTFKLSSVMVNAQAVRKAQADLEPLIKAIPADREKRKQYQLTCYVKKVHWDCPWEVADDSNLLKGIYEYGQGSWESIKMDTELKLHDKILPDGELKPQAKHLQTRADYLLKVLRKQADLVIGMAKPTARGRGRRKPKSRAEVIENDNSSGSEDLHSRDETNDSMSIDSSRFKKKPEDTEVKKEKESDISDLELEDEASSAPISIAAEENSQTETDPKIFTELRQCLLKIGDHINEVLSEMCDPDKIKFWRTHLWMFVSNFTDLDHNKLRKLYKAAYKRREDEKERSEQSASQNHSDSRDSTQGSKRMSEKKHFDTTRHNHSPQRKRHREDKHRDGRTPENGRSYSEEMLRKAMKKVWYKKMGLREAARVYSIPPSTLQQKLKALRLKQERARQKSGSSQEEENEPQTKRSRRESQSRAEKPLLKSKAREAKDKTRTSRTQVKPVPTVRKFISRTNQERAKYRGGINVMKSKGRESRVTSRSRPSDGKLKPKSKERRLSETKLKAKVADSQGVWDSELTPEEEERVVAWVLDFKCQGFPLKMDILLDAIQNILNENPYKLRSFMDNRPTKEWYQAFLRHHPEVSAPVPTARQISKEQERKRKATETQSTKRKAKQRKDSQADSSDSESEDSGNAGTSTDEEIDTNICSKCREDYDDLPDNWIGCSSCERWFHKYCIHIDVADLTDAEIEELDFKHSGVTNGPKAGGQTPGGHHHPMHRPPPAFKEVARPDHGPTTSPSDRWQHASPLARAEEAPRKSGSYRGDSHRPDHHREHYRPEYGHHYREQQHFSRQGDGWGQSSHHSYGDRKRRGEDFSDWGHRRPHKDPRLEHKDPRLEHKDPRVELKDPRLDYKRHIGQPPPPGELLYPKP
ncbi:hypothetical protein BaRGS_00024178 [Batillaria attramentaria]|uniref:DNA helicase n=1 Tax=Batillaria attramentaria TaxID=370345 RepID=A0ABD0KBU1_9CAEN